MKTATKKEKEISYSFSEQELLLFKRLQSQLKTLPEDGIILIIKDQDGRIKFNSSFTTKELNINTSN